MPGMLRKQVYTETEAKVEEFDAEDRKAVPKNSVILYEHKQYNKDKKGRKRIISVTEYSPTSLYSLHVIDFKDCLSSLRWNLDDGIVLTLYEGHDGGGRQYQIWGAGKDSDTHNNDFKDCASSWNWYRTS
jgi:hypothetical protein